MSWSPGKNSIVHQWYKVDHTGIWPNSTALRASRTASRQKSGRQGVGEVPGKDSPREPVDHREQEEEAPAHRDVGDVGCPDLIQPLDHEIAQEVQINFIPPAGTRGMGLPLERFDPHARHQGADVFAPRLEALAA